MAKRWACHPCAALLLALLPAVAHAEAEIAGHSEAWWREQALAQAAAVAGLEAQIEHCEETEAPLGGDVVDGYGLGRVQRRPALVPVKRCDDLRSALDDTRAAAADFEDRARQLEVPPGWLR